MSCYAEFQTLWNMIPSVALETVRLCQAFFEKLNFDHSFCYPAKIKKAKIKILVLKDTQKTTEAGSNTVCLILKSVANSGQMKLRWNSTRISEGSIFDQYGSSVNKISARSEQFDIERLTTNQINVQNKSGAVKINFDKIMCTSAFCTKKLEKRTIWLKPKAAKLEQTLKYKWNFAKW